MDIPELPPPSLRLQLRYWLRKLVLPVTLERRGEVRVHLRDAAQPNFDYFVLVVLSSMIATLGLLTNSGAVIIGAMLVAPLMSPIIGLGLSSLIGDEKLLRDSISALLRGAVIAVLIAVALTWANRTLPFVFLQELPELTLRLVRPFLLRRYCFNFYRVLRRNYPEFLREVVNFVLLLLRLSL